MYDLKALQRLKSKIGKKGLVSFLLTHEFPPHILELLENEGIFNNGSLNMNALETL